MQIEKENEYEYRFTLSSNVFVSYCIIQVKRNNSHTSYVYSSMFIH